MACIFTVCNEGAVRLVSEVFDYPLTVTGVLEVCINSNYTSVCTDSVDFNDPVVQAQAEFACEGLQYTGLVYCKYVNNFINLSNVWTSERMHNYITVYTSYNYFHLIGGKLLPPNENFTSSSSQVITNLSCSPEFTNFVESCKFDFTRDEVCLNHTMDLIVQCVTGRVLNGWIN